MIKNIIILAITTLLIVVSVSLLNTKNKEHIAHENISAQRIDTRMICLGYERYIRDGFVAMGGYYKLNIKGLRNTPIKFIEYIPPDIVEAVDLGYKDYVLFTTNTLRTNMVAVWGCGPDNIYDIKEMDIMPFLINNIRSLLYDPTNGVISSGDILYLHKFEVNR